MWFLVGKHLLQNLQGSLGIILPNRFDQPGNGDEAQQVEQNTYRQYGYNKGSTNRSRLSQSQNVTLELTRVN